MEHRGIKPGDHVEGILTRRRFAVEPSPWGDESWVDTHICGKAEIDVPTRPCDACHGWGTTPGMIAGLIDDKIPRKPCPLCKAKGFIPTGGTERLVLRYEQETEDVVNGKAQVEPKSLSMSLPLESFTALKKIKAEDVAEKRVVVYEIGKDGKRQAIGTRRKDWIMAQKKLEASGKANRAGDWRSHVTAQTVTADLACGILDPHLHRDFIGQVKKAVLQRTGKVG